jgi:hypothetical protein
MTVMTPAISHDISIQPGPPTVRAMSALTMKMPDPIMDPITIIVESSSLSSRLNSRAVSMVASAPGGGP